jgi:hypothetical protein
LKRQHWLSPVAALKHGASICREEGGGDLFMYNVGLQIVANNVAKIEKAASYGDLALDLST